MEVFIEPFNFSFFVITGQGKDLNYKWIEKMWHLYTMKYLLFSYLKKDEVLSFATIWMDLECIVLSEISQTERDKYCMLSLIHGR